MHKLANGPTAPTRDLRLHPARSNRLWLLTISLVFTIAGMRMIGGGQRMMGWLTTILFGAASAIFGLELFASGASYLELSKDGFIVCTLFRRQPLIRWNSVSEFRVVQVPPRGHKMVGFEIDTSGHSALAKVARGLTGASGALPGTYGREPGELAALMNEWRSRSVSRA